MSDYHYKFCRAGHLHHDDNPIKAKFCSECGNILVSACEKCGCELPGVFSSKRILLFRHQIELPARPDVCNQCGTPFPWSSKSSKATQSFSKNGDFVPATPTFQPGEIAEAIESTVNALGIKPSTLSLYFAFTHENGDSINRHRAKLSDLNHLVYPGKDLTYVEMSFDDVRQNHYSLTASFHGINWWLGLDASEPEGLAKFWGLLSHKFGLRTPSDAQNGKQPTVPAPTTQALTESLKTSALIKLVERKLRTAMRKRPADEKAVQDVVEALLLGADVPFSREQDTIQYSSRNYRPDFTLREYDLAIEVKFCAEPGRESDIIREINDDILAYRTAFKSTLFLIYDIGCIRDVDKFCGPFKAQQDVHICVIKH